VNVRSLKKKEGEKQVDPLVNLKKEMYLKYINFLLSILQIHLFIKILHINTLQLYFRYTKLVYLKSAKFNNLVFNAL